MKLSALTESNMNINNLSHACHDLSMVLGIYNVAFRNFV